MPERNDILVGLKGIVVFITIIIEVIQVESTLVVEKRQLIPYSQKCGKPTFKTGKLILNGAAEQTGLIGKSAFFILDIYPDNFSRHDLVDDQSTLHCLDLL